MSGKFGVAKELLTLALNRAERLQNTGLHARLERFMARDHMQSAAFETARDCLQSALKVLETIGSVDEIEEVLAESCDANFAAGDFKASRDHYQRALPLKQADQDEGRTSY